MLYNRCTDIYKFGSNTYPRRVRRRSNLGHIFREKIASYRSENTISQEPVAWPWCNLAARQRRPYCLSVNSHPPAGLVSRQWDAVEWAYVLCDRRIHNDRESRTANLHRYACTFYSSRAGYFWQSISSPQSVSPPKSRFGYLRFLSFPKTKIAFEIAEIC